MPYDHDFQFPEQPQYEITSLCHKCSKPRIYTVYAYRTWSLKYDCPINELCPMKLGCEHFSREPGVD